MEFAREPTVESGVCPWDEPTGSSGAGEPAEQPGKGGVKKPSIAVASTSEECGVCPWEGEGSSGVGKEGSSPATQEKTLEVSVCRSRKNSAQLDSGSSSSDISLAIAEVSDRLRRTCGLAQQNTIDGEKVSKSRKLAASCVEQRRSSVSIPPTKYSERPSVSSFEEQTGSCSQLVASSQDILSNSSDKDNNPIEDTAAAAGTPSSNSQPVKSLKKTSSVSSAQAPIIISVSSVTDDSIVEQPSLDINVEASLEELNREIEFPLAPLAVPDSESPGSDWVPEIPPAQPPPEEAAPEPPDTQDPPDTLDTTVATTTTTAATTTTITTTTTSTTTTTTTANVDTKQSEICPWEDE